MTTSGEAGTVDLRPRRRSFLRTDGVGHRGLLSRPAARAVGLEAGGREAGRTSKQAPALTVSGVEPGGSIPERIPARLEPPRRRADC
ncbi:MAG TPA: hypothetical protein VGS09_10675 [Actinomycetota bacterium]|nr:hypothetical protein [Actinomycetota bacterium]